MGILSRIFGVGGEAAAKPIEAVGGVLDSLFTSDEERLDKQILLERLAMKGPELQMAINTVEAQHRSIFVAGWRPFIGWVCGSALLYNYILRDIAAWIITNWGDASMTMPPALAMEHLMTILTGMLGLAGMRTYEKLAGRSK